MKSALLSLVFLTLSFMAAAQDSSGFELKEVRVLGEAKNKLGERIVVRELREVKSEFRDLKWDDASNYRGRHYYRFEFYSLGTLYDCTTTWNMSEPGKVTLTWSSDKKCEISLMDGWFTVTYNRDTFGQPWSFARGVD